jgi:hypothetical protein
MAGFCPSEPGLSTTGFRLTPDVGLVPTALGRRAELTWAALDWLVVTRVEFSRSRAVNRTAPGGGKTDEGGRLNCSISKASGGQFAIPTGDHGYAVTSCLV